MPGALFRRRHLHIHGSRGTQARACHAPFPQRKRGRCVGGIHETFQRQDHSRYDRLHRRGAFPASPPRRLDGSDQSLRWDFPWRERDLGTGSGVGGVYHGVHQVGATWRVVQRRARGCRLITIASGRQVALMIGQWLIVPTSGQMGHSSACFTGRNRLTLTDFDGGREKGLDTNSRKGGSNQFV